ncbi:MULTISPECIES: hypothetical protein [unclassified Methylobacter]|jgi:hypothetical protein|uniref:hypothetical protein n=1 Tax=unclassified Methylobacter TaxID=2635283 RepID=UPI00189635F2|nr:MULTISPECIES: hypothetical protein [unclassified Methylobacter]MBF6650041.1 hypothetical protein [Methylobacter sp. BlB1]WAK04363.1 hypothetical protein LZ558_22105 [Methylobacter sp. YRD-M1]
MILTPHEILKYLGFEVPKDGVEINPNDAYLISSSLRLIGQTMSVTAIPEPSLEDIHAGLAGLVAAWSNEDLVPLNENSVLKLRTTIDVVLTSYFKK